MIEYISVKKLKNYHRNPRKITSEAMAKLCENMIFDPEFMTKRPLLCYKQGDDIIVYAGNQRLIAAKKLKWSQIACIIEEDLDPEIIRRRIVLDNKSAGSWDYDILSADYNAEELFAMGFTEDDLFGKEEKEKAPPCKLKASVSFEDQEEMDLAIPLFEELCEKLDLKLTLGK